MRTTWWHSLLSLATRSTARLRAWFTMMLILLPSLLLLGLLVITALLLTMTLLGMATLAFLPLLLLMLTRPLWSPLQRQWRQKRRQRKRLRPLRSKPM